LSCPPRPNAAQTSSEFDRRKQHAAAALTHLKQADPHTMVVSASLLRARFRLELLFKLPIVGRITLQRRTVMGRGILLWLLGVPIPVIIILLLIFHH
jgi:hypothetical protein